MTIDRVKGEFTNGFSGSSRRIDPAVQSILVLKAASPDSSALRLGSSPMLKPEVSTHKV
jgi:hypothetical protein